MVHFRVIIHGMFSQISKIFKPGWTSLNVVFDPSNGQVTSLATPVRFELTRGNPNGLALGLFAIPRSRYLSRKNLTKRLQRPDESVRTFTAELRKLVTYCGYAPTEVDERLKENLIINTFSNEIRRKLFALPDDTPLNEIIKQMETLEQAARESKLTGISASGKSSASSARLQAAQTRGRRFPDSVYDESEFDYASVYGEYSVDFESDELDED